ncbi:prephenate dehydrogenase/arogenate dehydrogenase family protein [Haloarchaeobius iranensis]|uniref:Prephenate dehydrogenase n=1 Tax=Haloarchaeobius iranensis TaxID=996166 RepID=A0A1G9WLY6_9EURY|nr:prephenate dehydrogenase/arogenate dehydrogenase family protein [Haloarchaeobius iranensis]SDM85558.1 prephenate dehydrogenase [Haloarchaeobius iranensis]
MRTLVVGAGSMGRWLADALDGTVAFADTDPAAARAAAAAVGDTTTALDDTDTYDVVCFAVPMPVVAEVIAAQADRAEHALVDVTGEMTAPLSAMRDHGAALERMSLHPLFAPSSAPGRIAAVTDEPGPRVDAVRSALADAGNDIFETTADEHDEAMETVQASTHAAVLAYGLAAEPVDERFHTPVSADLQALVERVTDGDGHVYADIQSRFDGAAAVAATADRLADADRAEFEGLYERLQADATDQDGQGGA